MPHWYHKQKTCEYKGTLLLDITPGLAVKLGEDRKDKEEEKNNSYRRMTICSTTDLDKKERYRAAIFYKTYGFGQGFNSSEPQFLMK